MRVEMRACYATWLRLACTIAEEWICVVLLRGCPMLLEVQLGPALNCCPLPLQVCFNLGRFQGKWRCLVR
jgi:hypothetical protein